MSMKIFILLLLCSIAIFAALSGSIKEARINDNEMQPVTLRMGKSTVLRFEDKPERIVVGNQNYLNIEYVANDVTIQPLAPMTTNLFVYTKKKTYGFIVTVSKKGDYDDLIKVFWKRPRQKNGLHPEISLVSDKGIRASVEKVDKLNKRGWMADILLINTGSELLETAHIDVSMVDDEKRVVPIKTVFTEESIKARHVVMMRIFFQEKGNRFVLYLKRGALEKN